MIIPLNGINYDTDDLVGYGFFAPVTSGTGLYVSRWLAMYLDAIADATNSKNTTSTTSLSIGTGSKTFTMASPITYAIGSFVLASDAGAPTTNWMLGQVTARSGTSLTISVASGDTKGSGTIASWNLSLSAPRGEEGAAGAGSGDMLAATYDPDGNEEEMVSLTAAQNVENKTFVDMVGMHQREFSADGDYNIYLYADVAETLMDFLAISDSGSVTFDVLLKLDNVTTASLSSVTNSQQSDNTFVDSSVVVGQKLSITVSNFTGVGKGTVKVKTKKNVEQA